MIRITISQIEAFCWVAELGSLRQAAERLHLSQSTVSLRLRELQAQLAAPVLEPHGRGVRLTQAGHAFLAKAKLVLDAHAHMTSAATPTAISGRLRIGLAEGFAVACLAHLIPRLARQYPLLRPEWTVTTSSTLERSLIDGELDLAVLVDPVGDRAVRLIPLGSQPNVWAAAPKIAKRAGATPRERRGLTVVTTPPPTSMYRNTVAWFATEEQEPGPLCICTSVNAAAQLVGAGIGIGIFPARMVQTYGAGGAIAPMPSDPAPAVGRVYVADLHAGDRDRTEAVRRVLEQVTRAIGYFD